MTKTAARQARRASETRYVWRPAIQMTSGWMLCVLNPYANG